MRSLTAPLKQLEVISKVEEKLNKDAKRDGDISSCFEKWNSPVSKIKIYEKNIFDEEEKEQ